MTARDDLTGFYLHIWERYLTDLLEQGWLMQLCERNAARRGR